MRIVKENKMRTKKLLLVVVAVMLLIGMTSCGDKKIDIKDSKTLKTLNMLEGDGPLHLKYVYAAEDDATIEIYRKDENRSLNISEEGGASVKIITNATETYVIDEQTKLVAKVARKEGQDPDDLINVLAAVISIVTDDEEIDYLISTEVKKDGKTYQAEEYQDDEESKIQFLFEGEDLAYIIFTDNEAKDAIKVEEIGTDVDDSVFELPKGYEVLEG